MRRFIPLLAAIGVCGTVGCGGARDPKANPDATAEDAGTADSGGLAPDAGRTCPAACTEGLTCVDGACACAAPNLLCDGGCIPVAADNSNCGGCGVTCTGAMQCLAGTCTASKIEHVVLIVHENHTFDAYFGNYCTAPTGSNPTCTSGRSCCEAAPAVDREGTLPSVLDDAFNTASDPNHSQACELEEIDDGGMDEFTVGSPIGSSLCDSACSRTQNFAIADESSVAAYWQYADAYALADHYFQPIIGSSSSNDMYFAIAHEQFVDNEAQPESIGTNCDDPTGVCVNGAITTYLGRRTIADLLLEAGATFSVYADGYAEAVAASPSCASIPSECTYDEVLHPIEARSCLYDPSDIPFEYYSQLADDSHMKDYGQLAADVDAGALPNFSYVKARTFRNEHPGYSTISDGEAFATQTIELIEGSPTYANNTLVLLTWDEGGGFYDHMTPPPSVDTDDMGNPVPHGTRVPMLAIGAFVKAGTISHTVMDHSSVVRFLEYNFIGQVGQLGYADTKVNNLGSLLDPTTTGIPIPQ